MNIQYNALEYAHQLEGTGVPRAQAEVHANMLGRVLSDCVAAPADLRALGNDMTHQIVEAETGLRAEIAEAEARLRAEIAQVEARLGAKIEIGQERLSARIDKLDDAMGYLKWMNALTLALLLGLIVKSTFV
jgi:hypothetical protein